MNQRDVVINALGQARLEPYLLEVGGNKKRALNLYRWSVQLSSSIQETLGLTEVLLRNAIDEQLQKWNNKQLGKTTSWLLEPPATPLRSLVSRKREEALRRAHSSARLRTAGHPRYSAQTTHDDVLAHTMFGMWKDILPNHTPQSNLNSQKNRNRTQLWKEAVCQAFVYSEDPDGRKTFWRVYHLHGLRNRVSHMDSLLNVDVSDTINDAFNLVESINPQLQQWLSGTSTVRSVLRERP